MKEYFLFLIITMLFASCAKKQTANTQNVEKHKGCYVDSNMNKICDNSEQHKCSADCKGAVPKTAETVAFLDSTLIVDVRTTQEFAAGHIENSVNIPLDVVESRNAELKPYKNIIFVCRSGNRSGKATAIFKQIGFTNVYNGGGWAKFDEFLKNNISKNQ
jgi:rhodanese-related sulfurtransferase